MKLIRDLWIIARKDLTEFSRDKARLFSFFLMPVFMMVMVGFIFPNENALKNARIGYTNLDQGSYSQGFKQMLEKFKTESGEEVFNIKKYSSLEKVKEGIKSHEVNGGIYIPADFSEKIKQGKSATIFIVEDQANPQASQMYNQVLSQVVSVYSRSLSARLLIGKIGSLSKNSLKLPEIKNQKNSSSPPPGLEPAKSPFFSPSKIKNLLDPVKLKIEGIVPGKHNYFQFVAPGIIAMIVMTAVLTGLAASIAREKEQGTLDGVLISPIDRLAIILGKALAQTVRGLVQGSLVLLLAWLVFGVQVYGSLLLVFLILILGVFSFVGFGILVSAMAAEQETATQLLFMFQFPMLFLSGVFFPISMMPRAMQYISKAIPLTYAIEALRKVIVLGASLSSISRELLILFAFGFLTTSISVPIFKKMITR